MNGVMDAREDLKQRFEELQGSLDSRLGEESTMTSAIDELDALRQKVRAAEIDEEQRRIRAESVRRSMEALQALKIAPYEKELARLEEEVEKIQSLPVEERLFELQGVLIQLQEMEKFAPTAAEADIGALEERRYIYTSTGGASTDDASTDARARKKETNLRLVREIRDWADRIAQMDETEGDKLRPMLENLRADTPFPDRLVSLRDQTKTAWGGLRARAALTVLFREKLGELLDLLQASQDAASSREGSELVRRCDTLRGGKFIDRALFMTLYEDVRRFVWTRGEEIADAFFAQKVERALSEMGYELLTDDLPGQEDAAVLQAGRVSYLESPYEGYRVMVKVDSKGVVTTRLVRVVEAEEKNAESASAAQEQKDRETGKKWCHDFDGFLEKMQEQNLPLDVTLRKEPEETELLTVVDKNLKDPKARGKKGRKKREAELRERTIGGAYGAESR
jgi:hypothetical protein